MNCITVRLYRACKVRLAFSRQVNSGLTFHQGTFMSIPRVVAVMFTVGLMVVDTGVACGQAYPNKPLRIVIAGVGAGTDFLARLVGQGISVPLGQNVIVESRSGALLATEVVARSAPDGYTMLLIAGNLWTTPLVQKTNYDPVKDFSPITALTRTPNMLVVHPSVPAKSVRELIDLAKAKPGTLNYSIGVAGGATHLAGELFKSMASVNIVMVPYKSSAPALNAVLSGEVQLMFPNAPTAAPHVRSGRLRALGVGSTEPTALAPGVPTMAASGLPGFESTVLQCLFAPAKTPAVIIKRLNQEIVRFLNTPETKVLLLGAETESFASSPEQLAAIIKLDMPRTARLYKEIGMRAE